MFEPAYIPKIILVLNFCANLPNLLNEGSVVDNLESLGVVLAFLRFCVNGLEFGWRYSTVAPFFQINFT